MLNNVLNTLLDFVPFNAQSNLIKLFEFIAEQTEAQISWVVCLRFHS